ncbi:hypothetical protein RIF29_18153 [Crotalaria pallida]|uniref:Uncharacterized protein n=1 Tax=Crotalaria pallida TaxID=3830 RepID=A0AAN9FIJ6_CROPI
MYGHRADMCPDNLMETDKLETNPTAVESISIDKGVPGGGSVSGTVEGSNGVVSVHEEIEIISHENHTIPEESQIANNGKDLVNENPFGPWMLVKRPPRLRDRGGQKGGGIKVNIGSKKGQPLIADSPKMSGSRFNSLVEEDNGDKIEGVNSLSTCMLHEENIKGRSVVTVVKDVEKKNEVVKEHRIRNPAGGKNPQNRGPKNTIGPVKSVSKKVETSSSGSEILNGVNRKEVPPDISSEMEMAGFNMEDGHCSSMDDANRKGNHVPDESDSQNPQPHNS